MCGKNCDSCCTSRKCDVKVINYGSNVSKLTFANDLTCSLTDNLVEISKNCCNISSHFNKECCHKEHHNCKCNDEFKKYFHY